MLHASKDGTSHIRKDRTSLLEHLGDAHEHDAARDDAVAVVEVQEAQTRLEAVEAETGPGGQVVGEALVVHDFESGRVVSGSESRKGGLR